MMMDLCDRYEALEARIAAAAARAGRRADEITLVAVTKTWPVETLVAARECGMTHFGENRAEELYEKRSQVEKLPGAGGDIVWHAIGHLQSRKSDMVADRADVFHAMDRWKVARRLSKRLLENGRAETYPLTVFIEVNVSGETSKFGLDCSSWEKEPEQRARLSQLAAQVVELPGLAPAGLMTMAPWTEDEDVIRQVFRRTRQLAGWLAGEAADPAWLGLSMGMTDDYEIAVEEGATHLRVGRAIFGERQT
jgi:PLP dependent protein